jgi:hypothetical protein
VILPLLTQFGITSLNLGYFVLNNALNNNTTLTKLAKTLKFNPKLKRLCYTSYIFNLIAKRYLYGQDINKFKEQYSKAGALERRKLWRERNEVRKLYNLIVYIMALGKRIALFKALQPELNIGVTEGKQ